MIAVKCRRCGKGFNVKPSHLSYGHGKYCSRQCSSLNQRTGKEVACHICGKVVYRIPKSLKGSKSGKYFCGKSCQTLWRNQLYIGEQHANYRGGMYSYRTILGRSGMRRRCKLCGTLDARVIAVHHIDQNRKNNSIDNLAYLCHNCHHLVHRYKQEHDRFMATVV